MSDYEEGARVDVWDGDLGRWITGTVEGFQKMEAFPTPVMVVRVDEPDPGPPAVDKVPTIYAIVDMGMVRHTRSIETE